MEEQNRQDEFDSRPHHWNAPPPFHQNDVHWQQAMEEQRCRIEAERQKAMEILATQNPYEEHLMAAHPSGKHPPVPLMHNPAYPQAGYNSMYYPSWPAPSPEYPHPWSGHWSPYQEGWQRHPSMPRPRPRDEALERQRDIRKRRNTLASATCLAVAHLTKKPAAKSQAKQDELLATRLPKRDASLLRGSAWKKWEMNALQQLKSAGFSDNVIHRYFPSRTPGEIWHYLKKLESEKETDENEKPEGEKKKAPEDKAKEETA